MYKRREDRVKVSLPGKKEDWGWMWFRGTGNNDLAPPLESTFRRSFLGTNPVFSGKKYLVVWEHENNKVK